jgi:hypothetical protein
MFVVRAEFDPDEPADDLEWFEDIEDAVSFKHEIEDDWYYVWIENLD